MERIQKVLGLRIRQLRRERSLTTTDLAKRLNTTNATISRWENGKVCPPLSALQGVANFFSKPLGWFLDQGWDAERQALRYAIDELHQQPPFAQESRDVLLVGQVRGRLPIVGAISAGAGMETDGIHLNDVTEWFPVREIDWRKDRFVVRVVGDSMMPYLMAGDYIAFDEAVNVTAGSIVAALVDAAVVVKVYRVHRRTRVAYLASYNPSYDPILGGFKIQGVYAWRHSPKGVAFPP